MLGLPVGAAARTLAPGGALGASTRTLAGPDLAVDSVDAPRQVLTDSSFSIVVRISERTGELGASATVTASANGVVIATAPVVVDAGGTATLSLPATLRASGTTHVDIEVSGAVPEEAVLDNNSRAVDIEATDFQITPGGAVGPALAGYGAQFNQNVYATISRNDGVTEDNVRTLERSVLELRPQFSRIFFSQAALTDPDLMQSFVRTVLLAQRTGTTINITWQGGTLSVKSGTVQRFAGVLLDLVQKRGVTNLRWLTLQNEPNSTKMTPTQYEAQYRELDPYIANIRGQVHLMGGDLVQTSQDAWLTYMASNMADILDAYSIHVFWDYWDTAKLEARLTEVQAIVAKLPEAGRKPIYVTEYGIRGLRTFSGAPTTDPGVWEDGTPMAQTNVGAFQQAWFDVLAARLGYVGASKWDLYFGRYDKAVQAYYVIGGPKTGWPRHPLFNLLYLLTRTVKPGWHTVQLDAVQDTTLLLAAYAGPEGQWTVIGLDRAGGQLNTVSSTVVPYSIGGLPPSTLFRLVPWNEVGDGLNGPVTTVTTDEAGVAVFAEPQNAVFVLTTVTGNLWPRGQGRRRPTEPPDRGVQWLDRRPQAP